MGIQKSTRKFILCSMVIVVLCIFACHKIDYQEEKPSPEDVFFNVPANTDPTVKRIAEAMRRYNRKHNFISYLIKNRGFAEALVYSGLKKTSVWNTLTDTCLKRAVYVWAEYFDFPSGSQQVVTNCGTYPSTFRDSLQMRGPCQ